MADSDGITLAITIMGTVNAGALFAVAKAGFSIAREYGESKVKFDLMWADFMRRSALMRSTDVEYAHDHPKGDQGHAP